MVTILYSSTCCRLGRAGVYIYLHSGLLGRVPNADAHPEHEYMYGRGLKRLLDCRGARYNVIYLSSIYRK